MIDTGKYEEIMKHGWEVHEQLFVSGGKWRFAIEEYTQTDDMSKEEIEEWEEGLEPLWDALLQYIADAPLLLEEVKRMTGLFQSLVMYCDKMNYDIEEWEMENEAMG